MTVLGRLLAVILIAVLPAAAVLVLVQDSPTLRPGPNNRT